MRYSTWNWNIWIQRNIVAQRNYVGDLNATRLITNTLPLPPQTIYNQLIQYIIVMEREDGISSKS